MEKIDIFFTAIMLAIVFSGAITGFAYLVYLLFIGAVWYVALWIILFFIMFVFIAIIFSRK